MIQTAPNTDTSVDGSESRSLVTGWPSSSCFRCSGESFTTFVMYESSRAGNCVFWPDCATTTAPRAPATATVHRARTNAIDTFCSPASCGLSSRTGSRRPGSPSVRSRCRTAAICPPDHRRTRAPPRPLRRCWYVDCANLARGSDQLPAQARTSCKSGVWRPFGAATCSGLRCGDREHSWGALPIAAAAAS